MTREEQILEYANSFKGKGMESEELKEIISLAIIDGAKWADNHPMKPSLPSNLDEAAEEYAYNNWEDNDYHTGASEGLPFDAIGHTEKCFKAGAEWREQQIPKLPDNLDKAAEKYAKENCENYVDEEDGVTYIEEALRNTFKAGALWMAGPGVTCEGVIFG